MKPWMETTFCKLLIKCRQCRTDREWRQRLLDNKRVKERDFDCPRGWSAEKLPGNGDKVEAAVKPIAKALKLPCLKPDGTLKPESGCAKRRDEMNQKASPTDAA